MNRPKAELTKRVAASVVEELNKEKLPEYGLLNELGELGSIKVIAELTATNLAHVKKVIETAKKDNANLTETQIETLKTMAGLMTLKIGISASNFNANKGITRGGNAFIKENWPPNMFDVIDERNKSNRPDGWVSKSDFEEVIKHPEKLNHRFKEVEGAIKKKMGVRNYNFFGD